MPQRVPSRHYFRIRATFSPIAVTLEPSLKIRLRVGRGHPGAKRVGRTILVNAEHYGRAGANPRVWE